MPQPDKDQMIQQMLHENKACIEMPKYKCHKVVYALKIKELKGYPKEKPSIDELEKILASNDEEKVEILPSGEVVSSSDGAMMIPEDSRYDSIHLDNNYLRKHNPQVGGYYVVYEDGYKSFSPAKAFEKGYIRIS